MRPVITLLRSGSRLVVEPTTTPLREMLSDALSFTSKRFLYGKERYQSGQAVEMKTYDCYMLDVHKRIATSVGFYDRIRRLLIAGGYDVVFKDVMPHPKPEVLVPQWDRLFDPVWNIQLRTGQDEFLAKLAARVSRRLHCRFDCPPAYGKSKAIGFVGILYPKARIHVISKRVAVLRDRIYPELAQILPSVGIYGGGRKITDRRVMCYTVDSLGHSDGNADIVIFDEVHEAAADHATSMMTRYDMSVNIGLSATHDMRLDNKDMRVEAMFGPVVYKMDYSEAVAGELVVPLEVHWSDVVLDPCVDPCDGIDDPVERKRQAYWRNTVRNKIIADNARLDQQAGRQQLITCETLEHALFLRKLLPDFAVVYSENGLKPSDIRYYRGLGIWPEDMAPMTLEHRRRLTKAFESGTLKSVIATTVWNVGVDFVHLGVLNRADGGASEIMDTQIPGRASRRRDGKSVGLVRDYVDQFSRGPRLRARRAEQELRRQRLEADPSRKVEQQTLARR